MIDRRTFLSAVAAVPLAAVGLPKVVPPWPAIDWGAQPDVSSVFRPRFQGIVRGPMADIEALQREYNRLNSAWIESISGGAR